MGLTVYYDWKTKIDAISARRLIVKFRARALKLPFDEVTDIYEQDPPDGESAFRPCHPTSGAATCIFPADGRTGPRNW